MVKSILTYFIVFLAVGFSAYFIQHKITDNPNSEMFAVVQQSYLFHFVFSFLLCATFKLATLLPKYQNQLGFIYLGTFVFKIILYSAIFNAMLFSSTPLTKLQSASLLTPVFTFLTIEVYFISKILNNN